MSSPEDKENLRLLVQYVSRAFYESKYTIIMDQLSRHAVLKDEDLASRMGLQPKELNKVVATLTADSLVSVFRQNELKEGAQRAVGKQYYYIDYENFCNVVKWRIAMMFKTIDKTLRNELDQQGYVCPQCRTSYAPLDADKLFDMATGLFLCEYCRVEVIPNENEESVQGGKDRMQRFNHQLRFIREKLQQSEKMVLPAFDVAAWVKAHFVDPQKQRAAQNDGSGLKIAGSDPSKASKDAGIGVVISTDKDEATRKFERQAEAESKRQQNVLPSWHTKSTITGDLTALGIKETERLEQAALAANVMTDESLKGLGVTGRPSISSSSTAAVPAIAVDNDVKPVVNHEESLYEQYYARLAASAQATPASTGLGSDFGEPNEDEDQKPNVEYLDSLNAYRKRSRSAEDNEQSERPPKSPRAEGALSVNGTTEALVDEGTADAADDPLVYVNGDPIPYSQITEEHHELMTPEEYTAFYEIMQSRL
ncbi:hypothetical protein FISHEDRAFT_41590 [Fistulina hepatica ATCC 64428]|nr:hypothetical protein FISHEDRAFT_41590 [Fistulina hepatica ATCC 64428]